MLYKKASIVCQLLTFFTSIKPAPIVVTHPAAHHEKPTEQQAATQDPVSQKPTPCGQVKPECIPQC